jgi:hypothetical protein
MFIVEAKANDYLFLVPYCTVLKGMTSVLLQYQVSSPGYTSLIVCCRPAECQALEHRVLKRVGVAFIVL